MKVDKYKKRYPDTIKVNGQVVDFIPYRKYRTPKGGYYQGMKSKRYWELRSKERLAESFEKAEAVVLYEQKVYEKGLRDVVAAYKELIAPFMKDGELDADMLNKARIYDDKFKYAERRLLNEINSFCSSIPDRQTKAVQDLLEDVYVSNAESICKDLGMDVYTFDKRVVSTAVRRPWTKDGREFSDRIWANTEKLNSALRETLSNAVMRGEAPDKTIRELKKRFGNSMFNTARLVRTETAAIQTHSTIDAYKEVGLGYLEVVGSSDDSECSEYIGEKISVAEAVEGVNTPPFHCFCKCCVVPVVDWKNI